MPVSPYVLYRCLLLAVAVSLLSGCGSMFPKQTYRSQSPGSFGGGAPPRPVDPDGPTLVEELSEKYSKWFKPEPDAEQARQKYEAADELFLKKEYSSAVGLYEDAAELAPGMLREEDALFMAGECYFFDDRYPAAEDAYQRLLKKFSNTRHMDRVTGRLFAIAKYWHDHQQERQHWSTTPNLIDRTRPWFDTGGGSLRVFEAVWLNDPTGPLADASVMQTATTHFRNENWRDADQYYTQLRNDYPNSKYLVEAFLLGYRSKLNAYQGPGYDDKPLLEAERLIETLLTQFPGQLGQERLEMVEQAQQEVRAQKAERLWFLGDVFYRKGYNRGAAYYYQQVIKDYPDQIVFVQKVTERLKEISDKPPVPPDRLEWFSNLFPERIEIPKPIEPQPAN